MRSSQLFVQAPVVVPRRGRGLAVSGQRHLESYAALRPQCSRTRLVACADPPTVADVPIPIIGSDGQVAFTTPFVTGVFGVYDSNGALVYVGKSRDVATSLRRVLARRPSLAHGFVARTVSSGGRKAITDAMNGILQSWNQVSSGVPVSGLDRGVEQSLWESPIDVRGKHVVLEPSEQADIERAEPDEIARVLKSICRRFQAEIEAELKSRGLTERLKFAPKLKEKGLLDIESVKIKVPDTIGTSTVITEE